MIYGNPLKSHIVAVIVPEEEAVKQIAKKRGWKGDLKILCESKELRKAVEEQLAKEAEKEKLKPLELVKDRFVLSPVPWSVVGEQILTPTQKLKRHKATEYYQNELNGIYERRPKL